VTECDPGELLCTDGAAGPLCGSCLDGFTYSSSERQCAACDVAWLSAGVLLGALLAAGCIVLALRSGRVRLPGCLERSWLVGAMRSVDSGTTRVVWGTYQIVQSVTWSLDVEFPAPFTTMMGGLSVFSLDFLSLECAFQKSDMFVSVYLWSAAPVVVAVLLGAVHALRRRWSSSSSSHADLDRQHAYLYLLLSFLVVPVVTRKQLQASIVSM
jgi:hypothetical protein